MKKFPKDYRLFKGNGAKQAALAAKRPDQILGNMGIKTFFVLDNLTQYLDIILQNVKACDVGKNSKPAYCVDLPCFFEHTPSNAPVNMFYDVEATKEERPEIFDNHPAIALEIKTKTIGTAFNLLFLFFRVLCCYRVDLQDFRYDLPRDL